MADNAFLGLFWLTPESFTWVPSTMWLKCLKKLVLCDLWTIFCGLSIVSLMLFAGLNMFIKGWRFSTIKCFFACGSNTHNMKMGAKTHVKRTFLVFIIFHLACGQRKISIHSFYPIQLNSEGHKSLKGFPTTSATMCFYYPWWNWKGKQLNGNELWNARLANWNSMADYWQLIVWWPANEATSLFVFSLLIHNISDEILSC